CQTRGTHGTKSGAFTTQILLTAATGYSSIDSGRGASARPGRHWTNGQKTLPQGLNSGAGTGTTRGGSTNSPVAIATSFEVGEPWKPSRDCVLSLGITGSR